jgi:dTDP-4-dehydrorhamnose reductase
MVCEGLTSRLEVAKELLALTYMEDKITITEVSSDHFSEEYFAERPNSECLINKRLNELDLNVMRDWKIALEEYISSYYVDYLSWSNVSSKGLDK